MAFRIPLDNYTVTQGFGGNADYYAQFGQSGHNGIDLAAPHGTPVYAPDDGVIAFEGDGVNHGWMSNLAGYCILINCGGSYAAVSHLSRTVVDKGQTVSKGQLIGYVGATGAATGPHTHFEMLPLSPNFKNGFAGRIDISPYIEYTKNATDDQVRQAYREILEREADDAGIAHYRNYTIEFVRSDLMNSGEKRTLDARKAAQALADAQAKEEAAKTERARLAAIEAQKQAEAEAARIAAEEESARLAAEAKANDYVAIAKANNDLLKKLWEAVKLIAARFGINL